ncbi:hypothetical protein KIK22_003056 [Escherichia coli]|uniref:hypothetical protein n=1 Tax=Escherichia coli TaxID=562 RepID=UPI000224529F|nr:hypothetical protein [Escherichia coli]EEV2832059.1 hypothetical protein [Escherichia coli O91:H21]EHY2133878.1 hypothetical protein [Escherichia coli O157]ELO0553163.1 hypothetical protein [Escherichia coli O91]ATO76581.1 hypothetical protein I51_10735 [Escherichia coli O91 str. RM7190]EEQ6926483.1 hypothetical protein [Escherichia coli]
MHYAEFQAEATANGIQTGSMTIDYHDAIRRLDAGEFDTPNVRGLRILQCLAQADEAGLLGKLPVEMKVAQWRWLYVTTFINEEEDKNGTIDVPNEHGTTDRAVIYNGKHGVMTIYPSPIRFALQQYIEWNLIQTYGEAEGMGRALFLYQKMLTTSPDKGFILSDIGREGLELLLDEIINDLNTHGMPEGQ